METAELLDRLGYQESGNYLRKDRGDFDRVVDYGHLFRRAAKEPCRLQGVYALRASQHVAVPIVYVCDAPSEEDAKKIHRLVWNQDTVPFLIVNSPETVRVYPGFSRERSAGRSRGLQRILQAFSNADIERIAQTLHADAVDSGQTWNDWGQHILPQHKVHWQLLSNLKRLDDWLQQEGLARRVSHALIGKYVYLYYLRQRGILRARLKEWQVPSDAVFGPKATAEGLRELVLKLDRWPNGEIFPIDFSRRGRLRDDHIAQVAATFDGARPLGAAQWQLHLDFRAYDFSYIPIEVLSMVYEQFLKAPGKGSQDERRLTGAYYTPIPVVNFMLSELEQHLPLQKGMRVFDPACGSGAFLVQAFRRLIEKEFPPDGEQPSPVELRELLENHFFGLDIDEDACGVARLSLVLTLLDYLDPRDLDVEDRRGYGPPLPDLRENIVCGNFFHDGGDWQRLFARKKADWVVGNPPWKQLKEGKKNKIRKAERPVLAWITHHEEDKPVGNQQMARAFAWVAAEYVSGCGEVALFLPAMSLFEEAATAFRSRFFHEMQVHTIANFSNLRWVISAGRSTAPAAAFLYRPRPEETELTADESIRTYSPLVANQEATRPAEEADRTESWSIVVNASEIRDVPLVSVLDGNGLPWKTALWGSELDLKLVRRLRKRFPPFEDMEKQGVVVASQGLALRPEDADEPLEPVSGITEARTLDLSTLKGMRHFFVLPSEGLLPIPKHLTHARKGRVRLPLSVSRPPHVLVSAARNFAVYSEDFIIVPPRQIGIASPTHDEHLLKALSLFLSSDFAFYFEFFTSTELGIGRDRSTLKALRRVPTPLTGMSRSQIRTWARLHDRLAKGTRGAFEKRRLLSGDRSRPLLPPGPVVGRSMLKELNTMVYAALGLRLPERALVHDLVRVRLALNNGALGKDAVRQPTETQMRAYGARLKAQLDEFIRGELSGRHDIEVIHDDCSGMIHVNLVRGSTANGRVSVTRAGSTEAADLEKCRDHVRQQRSQWVYFDRNLRAYEGTHTYVLKPMQRFHWTETQARIDAMDIVAESIARRNQA